MLLLLLLLKLLVLHAYIIYTKCNDLSEAACDDGTLAQLSQT